MDKIQQWTQHNKMKLNGKKTKLMIINFTRNYQFSSRNYLQNELIEIIEETKLLGCVLSSDLKFHKNTEFMKKKAFSWMILLQKYSFNVPTEDLSGH